MTRRNIELLLLCVAAPIVVLLFAMLALTQGDTLGLKSLAVPLGVFAAFILAHLAVRKFAPNADPALLPITFALSGIGIAFVTRLAPDLAVKQVVWLFLGIACMVAVLIILRNLDKLAEYKYTLATLGFILLLSPLLPVIGQEYYGSRIWLSIAGASFQPGEIAKICIIIFMAAYLAQNRELMSEFTWQVGPLRLPDIRIVLPLLIMWGISLIIVIFEKDLGSAAVLFVVFLAMLYIVSGKKFYLIVGFALAAIAAVFLYLCFGHVQVRVATWLDPFADPQNTGYQLVQAIYSIADGGLFGVGIGNGLADSIPVVESDFIFAAIAEETGLLGAAAVLLLFMCFAIRGFVTAARAKSDMSSFTASGLTTTIVLQAFIIVGGVTRLIPLTGLTLPFISQGGSSLLASFIIVGLLLRCGDEGTGVEQEMTSVTSTILGGGVLGRVALGKNLTRTLIAFSVLFALLVANLTVIMVVKADYYQNMPGNNHTIAHEARIERGTIATSDGVVLAQSVKGDDGSYTRVYPSGDLASHVVGYASTRFGTAGIENYCNAELKGSASYATWNDVIDALNGTGQAGNDVTLTIDSRIQEAAQEALEGEKGACIVMDPATGAVLALASAPTYDVSDIESVLEAAANGDDTTALYNRATQALYAPGSTFKIVTLATALEEGATTEDTVYSGAGSIEIGGGTVTNFNEHDYGDITLRRATEVSSNTVFAQVGVELGAIRLVKGAELFRFNKDTDFELPLSTSLMPDPVEMTEWETAWAAAGEPVGTHESPAGPQVSVMQMALVVSAIAQDGSMPTPYLVESIHNAQGQRSYAAEPTVLGKTISATTASRVRDVLRGVVERGTGTAAQIDGADVWGKTGTAEKGTDKDDSWFVGCATVDSRSVVIAIVVEDGDEGVATRKAQNVLSVALDALGIL